MRATYSRDERWSVTHEAREAAGLPLSDAGLRALREIGRYSMASGSGIPERTLRRLVLDGLLDHDGATPRSGTYALTLAGQRAVKAAAAYDAEARS